MKFLSQNKCTQTFISLNDAVISHGKLAPRRDSTMVKESWRDIVPEEVSGMSELVGGYEYQMLCVE